MHEIRMERQLHQDSGTRKEE
uniref:Uncharacterized protein n=1 Tax=Arundo donax TaxID=35708 RepID=A0A0A9E9W5_ARUDO